MNSRIIETERARDATKFSDAGNTISPLCSCRLRARREGYRCDWGAFNETRETREHSFDNWTLIMSG